VRIYFEAGEARKGVTPLKRGIVTVLKKKLPS